MPLRRDVDVTPVFRIFLETFALLRAMPPAGRVGALLYFVAGVADGVLLPFFALWARSEGGVPVEFAGVLLACYAGGELRGFPAGSARRPRRSRPLRRRVVRSRPSRVAARDEGWRRGSRLERSCRTRCA